MGPALPGDWAVALGYKLGLAPHTTARQDLQMGQSDVVVRPTTCTSYRREARLSRLRPLCWHTSCQWP
eukprot:scaffold7385_cov533-Prasinococcus_capsulatus_cf.AAC.3